jgi:hypothetical protein
VIVMALVGCSPPAVTSSGRVDLQAACFLTPGASSPRLKFTISNETTQHLSIRLGYIPWKKEPCMSAFSLRLRRPERSDEEPFVYHQPQCSCIAGRADPWRLEMMAGGRTSLEFDGVYFWSERSWRRFTTADRGALRIVLQSANITHRYVQYQHPSIRGGVVESDWVRFPEECEPGS